MGNDIYEMETNRLPVKTWNHLRVNESRLGWEKGALHTETLAVPEKETELLVELGQGTVDFGGQKKVLITPAEFDEREISIAVPAGRSLTVYALCDAPVSFACQLKCDVERAARLRLIQLILTPRGSSHVLKIEGQCADDASLEVLQLFLGAGSFYSECVAQLCGEGSAFAYDTAYLAGAQQRVDYNIVANHIGKRSQSAIHSDGALRDGAFKVFRGTIDFKNGSSASEGAEQENVLLLGDELCNQSVPLILCAEENVKGAHGASVGELDEDMLLYFAARGMDKDTAENHLTRGRLSRCCERLGAAVLQERAERAMAERLGMEEI